MVEKSLEKDPAERYQSMRDMVVDLRRLTRTTVETRAPAATRRAGRAGCCRARDPRDGRRSALDDETDHDGRAAHSLDRRAAAPEPLARSGPGVLLRRHDGSADLQSGADPRPRRHLAHVDHALQGHDQDDAGDWPRAGRGRDRRSDQCSASGTACGSRPN